jgi:uncharacterized cysteine cluster protein YcgN (CxxCxxCC family)
MAKKKKKTFAEKKKEAVERNRERETESLCRRCGACCHIKIGLSDGSYVVHPYVSCKYLSNDNLCAVYERRDTAILDKLCFTREEMINKDYILVEGCPYLKLRPGYKPARLVTKAEFDDIIAKELELGNYNILLANRVF